MVGRLPQAAEAVAVDAAPIPTHRLRARNPLPLLPDAADAEEGSYGSASATSEAGTPWAPTATTINCRPFTI